MNDQAAQYGPIGLREAAEALKPAYRRLALTVSPEDASSLSDSETLVVCSDWLSWQRAADRPDIVHYEYGLLDWNDVDRLDTELFLRADSWVYRDGVDCTVFEGVSLGKSFQGQLALALCIFARMKACLRAFVRQFGIEEIAFVDFSPDIDFIPPTFRSEAVRMICDELGIPFLDMSTTSTVETAMSENFYSARSGSGAKDFLRRVYVLVVEWLSWLSGIAAGRPPRVLLLVGTNLIEPLLWGCCGNTATPVVQAAAFRKNWRNILAVLRSGARVTHFRDPPLRREHMSRIGEIKANLEDSLDDVSSVEVHFLRRIVIEKYIPDGALERSAINALSVRDLLERTRPDRIVVDGVRNPPVRTAVELARDLDIPVDYIWHAPLSGRLLKNSGLNGDAFTSPLVKACLTWGRTNEEWLRRIGADVRMTRVGSPIATRYRNGTDRSPSPRSGDCPCNVLVLQYAPMVTDPRSINARLYEYFVEIHQTFAARGITNLRFKLHPGPKRWKPSYFEAIAREFGFDTTVLKTTPFDKCLEWADLVIGPPVSGAMFETLASGKPYHAVALRPHSFDLSVYGTYPIHESIDAVIDAAVSGEVPDGRKLLDDVYAVYDIPDSVDRFWQHFSSRGDGAHARTVA